MSGEMAAGGKVKNSVEVGECSGDLEDRNPKDPPAFYNLSSKLLVCTNPVCFPGRTLKG